MNTYVTYLAYYAVFLTCIKQVMYRIAGNFCLEKIFAFFAQARRGRNFFRRIILPSENFVTLKFLHTQILHMAAKQYYY